MHNPKIQQEKKTITLSYFSKMYFLKFHEENIKKFNDIFKMLNPWKYKEIFQHMNEFLTDYNTSLYPSHCGNISQPNIIF